MPNTKRRENVLAVLIALFRRKAREPNSLSNACQALPQNETVRHVIRPGCVERGRDEFRGLSTLLQAAVAGKLAFALKSRPSITVGNSPCIKLSVFGRRGALTWNWLR